MKKALEEANLKIRALDTLIDIAEEQLKIDIRKSLVPGSHQNETEPPQTRDQVTVQTVWQDKTCLLCSSVAGTRPGSER
ncbi:hypothetical protein [Pedobacter steynii]